MPFVKINEDKLWEGLNGLLDIDEFKEKIKLIQKDGFGPEDIPVAGDIFKMAIETVENICIEAGVFGFGKEKKKAVVKFLDDIIRLPFYLEWLDGPAIGAIVDLLVSLIFPKKG